MSDLKRLKSGGTSTTSPNKKVEAWAPRPTMRILCAALSPLWRHTVAWRHQTRDHFDSA